MEVKTKSTYQPYPKYKDSGIKWIGKTPEHWELDRMRRIFKEVSIKNRPNEKLLSVTQSQGVVPRELVENRMVMPTGNLETFKFIERGDFAISLRSFEGGLEYSNYKGIISPAYTVLKIRHYDVESNYYKFLFKSYSFISSLQISTVGIREGKNISYNILSNSFLPIPPKPEQTRIANFLDRKCEQIDKAIAQKERLIELLKERRQIIIQNAVTRGLDPNVKLKDSGVEWIGKIPEHWEVKRLKYVFNMLVSNVDKNSRPNEIQVKLCNYVDVYNNNFITSDISFMDDATASKNEIEKFKIKTGDIIITKDSEDWEDIGVPSLVKHEEDNLICGYHLAILRSKSSINADYFFRLFQSSGIGLQFSLRSNGITRYGITHRGILGTWLIIPPIKEQENIADYINNQSKKIEQAIDYNRSQIEKLKEYKSVLIDSAVTGKIKV